VNKYFIKAFLDSLVMRDDKACGVIAVSIACDVTYKKAYKALESMGREHGNGTRSDMYRGALDMLGYKVVDVTRHYKSKTPLTLSKEIKNKKGSYILRITDHAVAIKDGEITDWTKDSRRKVRQILKIRKK
jgi:hypothetical protein